MIFCRFSMQMSIVEIVEKSNVLTEPKSEFLKWFGRFKVSETQMST